GAAIANELIEVARGGIQGIYLVPSFNRYELAAELIQQLKGTTVATGASS
ncbi:MAG: hypothetical protein IH959_05385, partial [Chloroflexi bacterium]|nr:hypothetical protein [Chloroflexota bacterium]